MNIYGKFDPIHENNGKLTVIEFDSLPFIPQRAFYVRDAPINGFRGAHAHKTIQQILICINGLIICNTYDGKEFMEYSLHPNYHLFLDKMVWSFQTYKTGYDTLMVLCSDSYKEEDYITDIKEFEQLIKGE